MMHHFIAVTDCHRLLLEAAERLREELHGDKPSATLLRLRLEMAMAARSNLAATQKLCSHIDREIPDIANRFEKYDRLKAAESDLHVRYAGHIATWTVAAISGDFKGFVSAKRQFLGELDQHIRCLESEFFEPARKMLESAPYSISRTA